MRTKPESTEANLHLGRGCGLSPNPPEQTRILGADAADPGVVSCARSVTHRRMRSLPCSSPPSARHAPHPNLRRPPGGSGLPLDRYSDPPGAAIPGRDAPPRGRGGPRLLGTDDQPDRAGPEDQVSRLRPGRLLVEIG